METNGTALAVQAPVLTVDQIALAKRTICPPDATDDEFRMFLHICTKSGLDPLQKQIHFTKRSGRVTVIAGIDGLRARAAREPDFAGLLHGVVCAKDDFQFDATSGQVIKHTYNAFADRGAIVGAWASVHRKGRLPFTALVRFAEFNQPNSPTWKQMPNVMIDKCAQSTALRMAYPEQFSAIYEQAEMDQAEIPTRPSSAEVLKAKLRDLAPPADPVEAEVVEPEHATAVRETLSEAKGAGDEYVILWPIGKHKGKPVIDVPRAYLEWAVEEMKDGDTKNMAAAELARRDDDADA